jgi:Lar family restriction alleviation protein
MMGIETVEAIAEYNDRPTWWELKGKKLKPCPFCGGVHIIYKSGFLDGIEDELYWMSCALCLTEGPTGKSRHWALRRWQDRATKENL